MQYRHLLLIPAALIALHFVLVFSNIAGLTWAEWQIRNETSVLIALLVLWAALEATRYVMQHRTPRCACGYSLAGLRCPECGRIIGSPDDDSPTA